MWNKIPDVYVGLFRQVLVGIGTPIAAKYGIDAATTGSIADLLLAFVGAGFTLGSAVWLICVKSGTRSVPTATADRKDVPTINPITGSVERTTK